MSAALSQSSSSASSVAPNTNVREQWFPALDGLRGVAILSVMLLHFTQVPGLRLSGGWSQTIHALWLGWAGVDLFFALSGFLITTILLRNLGSERFFTKFYARRALRIFPLYFIYLAIYSFAWIALSRMHHVSAAAFQEFRAEAPYLFSYTSNFYPLFHGELTKYGTGHFWSLAVEEQFYLVWPLLLYLTPRQHLMKLSLGLFVVASLIRLGAIAGGMSTTAIYTLLPMRMDALLAGAIPAIASVSGRLETLRRPAAWIASICGPLAIAVLAIFGPSAASAEVEAVGFPLLSLTFGAIVVLAATSKQPSPLSGGPLAFLGKYSYGLYVTHVLVRSLLLAVMPSGAGGHTLGWLAMFAGIGMITAIGVAVVVYHLVERPFLDLKRLFGYAARSVPEPTAATREPNAIYNEPKVEAG